MDRRGLREGKSIIIGGLVCMIAFFIMGMLLGYLSEYEGTDLPWFVESFFGLFLEKDLFPSMTMLEQYLKYAHIHGEGLGVFAVLYGLLINWCSTPFVLKVSPYLVLFGIFIIPIAFLSGLIYPKLIYMLPFGSVALSISFLFLIYDIIISGRRKKLNLNAMRKE